MIAWVLLCLCLALFAQDMLPAKYLFDTANIKSRFGYVHGFSIGKSYDNTALFYELLLLSESQHAAAFIFSAIFFIILLKCMVVGKRIDLAALHAVLIFSFSCIVGAVYLGQYSKESTSILLISSFLAMASTARGRFFWLAIASIYAAYFRPYWFIVIALYIFYRFILTRATRSFVFVLSILFAILSLAISFKVILGIDLAYYRYMVNDTRTYDLAAETMIKPILPVGGIGLEWCNGVLQFLMMFFPVPLISGNPVYLMFFVIIASLGVRVMFMLKNIINSSRENKFTMPVECLALFVSFVTVQSIFEPDYGSYIRHLMPLLPVAIFAICREELVLDCKMKNKNQLYS
ncbi:hypothetical protein [Paraburkholderia sp. J67]|uniref:hypothetical protein n=1 Tax=Paraburkholderia sp. J67 TaxID=2805435 RepID=UPI002ABDD037|nr:hypothetical protein [Paraburkholderia sp. J67]